MTGLITRVSRSAKGRARRAWGDFAIDWVNCQVAVRAHPQADTPPVVFFNASTRLQGMSLNAAYSLITSWAMRMAGVPVIHFVCQSGLSRCVLGTNRDKPTDLPPCPGCIAQSRKVYGQSDAHWFIFKNSADLEEAIAQASVAELMDFSWKGVPLGRLALPSMRWVLRRHTLKEDESTRFLYRQYVLSAWRVQQEFSALLEESKPQAVVCFNGMFYPEATARWVAQQRGIRVVAHEVGLQPYTAFFTTGEPTAYPIDIPDSFQLTPEQDARLDDYLSQRMQGNFSMAGMRFWPEMRRLDDAFLARLAQFKQMVPVFTNVIFDTSQPHSNVVFADMFAWLDSVAELAKTHDDTLFVIRAHPDEARPGKQSRESVAEWVAQSKVTDPPNVIFVPPQEYISSYELIERAAFVMVYNSTIGLEAAIMGAAVLCAGKARFTQLPTVFFPPTPEAFRQQASEFLAVGKVHAPEEFQRNARRFLYYQLYRTSLPFHQWIEEDGLWRGYVRLKTFDVQAFDPQNSPVLQLLVEGILHDQPFLLKA